MGVFYNITLNYISYIQIVTTKEKLLVLKIKAKGYYLRQATSIVRQIAIIIRQVTIIYR
jgi:hypothetical protein